MPPNTATRPADVPQAPQGLDRVRSVPVVRLTGDPVAIVPERDGYGDAELGAPGVADARAAAAPESKC
jgi:hypothetical protein